VLSRGSLLNIASFLNCLIVIVKLFDFAPEVYVYVFLLLLILYNPLENLKYALSDT